MMQAGPRLLRIAAWSIGACIAGISPAGLAQDRTAPVPVPVTQPDGPNPLPPPASPAPDPMAVPDIRIENNGALITGPIGQRRVYIPLDKNGIPRGFRGLWAKTEEVCAAIKGKSRPQDLLNAGMLIGEKEMTGRTRFTILETFVPVPDSFTMVMLDTYKPLHLPASRYRDARSILVIFASSDGARNYAEMSLSGDGKGIDLQNGNSHEQSVRCPR